MALKGLYKGKNKYDLPLKDFKGYASLADAIYMRLSSSTQTLNDLEWHAIVFIWSVSSEGNPLTNLNAYQPLAVTRQSARGPSFLSRHM